MGLKNKNGKLWFFEDLYNDATYGFEVSKVIVPEMNTGFQKLMILDTPRFGKVLTLDGIVQLTEEDESLYHENMSHWPLFSHPKPKTVFIVGGGDGGIAREVLKHKSVEKVYLVDIDPKVTELVKKYMPQIPNGAFSDPRLKVIHADAEKQIREFKDAIDILIIDSVDTIGPATSLFGTNFIQNIYRALKTGGIMMRQAGSVIMQPYGFKGSYKQTEVIFGKNNVKPILISPAARFGGYFGLIAALKGKQDFSKMIGGANERYEKSGIATSWYSGRTHKNLSAMPPNVSKMISKERYGEEVIMEFPGLSFPGYEKTKKWSSDTCRAINMLAYGKPMMTKSKFEKNDSFVQYIETSAINYRHFSESGAANIFTCAELPVKAAIESSLELLEAKKGIFFYLPRGSFGNIGQIKEEASVFSNFSGPRFAPKIIASNAALSAKFETPIERGFPAFELAADLYGCDYEKISSTKKVADWAKKATQISGLKPIGKTDVPDFGHAQKKTAGPSVAQFFEGGTSISHYSSNWLAIFVNIVSQKNFDIKKVLKFTMEYFNAQKAVCWIIPRGINLSAAQWAKSIRLFEVSSDDIKR